MDDPIDRLGLDPAGLDVAPSRVPPSSMSRARLSPPTPAPCSVCGDMAVATRIVTLDDDPHWLDLCRAHLLAAAGRS